MAAFPSEEEPEIDPALEREPTEISYDEQFYPARPRAFRPRARLRTQTVEKPAAAEGEPVGTNPFYVAWLRRISMLHDANTISAQLSGQGSMWQNPYASPSPTRAIETAPVWFTAYPHAFVTRPDESFLAALAESGL
ncbi:MAG: maltose alpha-D-glucosyltransferase, partial [Marmoricola sp.]